MFRYAPGVTAILAVLVCTTAIADSDEEIFEADDHCVAYRTSKDLLFGVDVEVIGRSCEVTASLIAGAEGEGPQIVVSVPAKSFKSGNIMRNKAVRDILGAEKQPDLLFTSNPIDLERLRGEVEQGRVVLPGRLSLDGRGYPVDFPLELVEHEGHRYVKGRLETTFEEFEVEVPTIALGLIARPHEELELIVNLELERVVGFEAWAASVGLF